MCFMRFHLLFSLIIYCFLVCEGVYKPNVIIKGVTTFNAEETLQLTCVASFGTFKRWLSKNDRTLSTLQDPRVSIEKTNENNVTEIASLRIVNTTVSDNGLYTCEGLSINGIEMNATEQVIVKGNENI